jgi:hypothetical protein
MVKLNFRGYLFQCSGDCFNLTRSRSVICIKGGAIVGDSGCDAEKRPESAEKCDISDYDDCKARWHYSEWNEVRLLGGK